MSTPLLSSLVQQSDGYNYNAIDLVGAYLRNLIVRANSEVNDAMFKQLLEQAFKKASGRSDVAGLRRFDNAARKMVGADINQASTAE